MVIKDILVALIAVTSLVGTGLPSKSVHEPMLPPVYLLHDALLLQNALIQGDVAVEQLEFLVETGWLGHLDLDELLHSASPFDSVMPAHLLPVTAKKNLTPDSHPTLARQHLRGDRHPGLEIRTLESNAYDLKLREVNIVGDSQFGRSVTMAGDVNGDGFDDVIVGAYAYYNASGRCYVYFGGSAPDSTPDITLDAENVLDIFGMAVGSAGDVNGDGFDDIVIGAPGYGADVGRSYVYFGGSEMDTHVDLVLDGEDASDGFGVYVGSAGDVNGDGYDDIVVGATGHNTNTGRVYIYFGGQGIDSSPDVVFDGEDTWNIFGISVAGSGDINDDGYDDVVVGAPWYAEGIGRAYVYFGGMAMDNEADVLLDGETVGSSFGYDVAELGNINGDGYDDVVVGAPGYGGQTGRIYVFYGSNEMDTAADAIHDGEGGSFGYSCGGAGDVNSDGNDDVVAAAPWYGDSTGRVYVFYGGDSVHRNADVTIDGDATESYLGMSVDCSGNMNGDSFDDLLVGAPGYNDATGRAHLYYGDTNMNSVVDLTLDGEGTLNRFGESVAGSGDMNGDGYDDIVVGAPGYHSYDGRAYVYLGGDSMDSGFDVMFDGFGSQVAGAGDVNADGYDDIIVGFSGYDDYTGRACLFFGGSTLDDDVDLTFEGEAPDNYFGWSVAGAGDVNNDGFDDVIVGAIWHNGYRGRVYIYFGGNNMDNIPDVLLNGDAVWDEFGWSVAGGGDVNNDGYTDIVVGARGCNNDIGRAYVFFGGGSMDALPDVTLEGEDIDDLFGSVVSGLGDVNGDGYDDLVVGTYRHNDMTGRVSIYFGGNSMDPIADMVLNGENTGDRFGQSAAGAGDVNEDGFDDVVVGADGYGSFAGRVYVYLGNDTMDEVADVILDGEGMWNEFGCAVASVRDVNGEGSHDIIVGALHHPANGAAYVYFGEPYCISYQWEIPRPGDAIRRIYLR